MDMNFFYSQIANKTFFYINKCDDGFVAFGGYLLLKYFH